MTVSYSNGALQQFLTGLTDDMAANSATVWLFTNSPTLDADTERTDFTEPTFVGYFRLSLPDVSSITGTAGVWTASFADVTWTTSSSMDLPQTINGYFVVLSSESYLFGEYLPEPFTFVTSGQSLTIAVRLVSRNSP